MPHTLEPITKWYRHKGKDPMGNDLILFNHIENGWAEADTPTPHSPDQKRSWSNSKWTKEFVWLDENHVVRDQGPDEIS